MITKEELKDILKKFGQYDTNDIINVDGDIMTFNGQGYVLDRNGELLNVTGLGWGSGTLYVGTKEYGTIGVRYEHEITVLSYDEDEPIEYETLDEPTEPAKPLTQSKLERWFMGCC